MSLKVFITGASSGIGEALAQQYAANGATLGLAARRMDVLEQLRSRIVSRAGSGTVEVYATDVTSASTLARVASEFNVKWVSPLPLA